MYYIFFATIQTPLGRRRSAFAPIYFNDLMHYNVTIEVECHFQMILDEKGYWRIVTTDLPQWVYEKELELNCLIEAEVTRKNFGKR